MYTFSKKLKTTALILMILGLVGIVYGFLSAPKTIEEAEKIVAESHHEGHSIEATNHDASKVATMPSEEIKTSSIKNSSPFIGYKGAIIRNITINKVNYGNSIVDTSQRWTTLLDNVTNLLHNETRAWTIKRNLFFHSGDILYPFLLADNERYLRTLPFIQDSKIIVKEIGDYSEADSVDIVIFYKEVFALGFNLEAQGTNQFFTEVKDENIRGSGDQIIIRNFTDLNRTPHAGWGAEYTKHNILGSFVNLIGGATNFNQTINNGNKQELYTYLSLDFPLVSPYRRFTGNITAASHQNENRYSGDSIFRSDLNYYYKQLDCWVGLNLSSKSLVKENLKRLTRYFLAFRSNYRNFENQPFIYQNKYNYLYANSLDLLVSATAFKQDFYKTSFIYGFGRNEDIPEGINCSVTGGWTNKFGIERWYSGIDLEKSYYNKNGTYFNWAIKGGSYLNKGDIEDANLLVSADVFSKLYQLGNSHWLLRHFIDGSMTKQYKALLNVPLMMNSSLGIPQLVDPDTLCNTRFTLNVQSVFFNTYSFAGFRFAPFTFGTICYVRTQAASFGKGDGYTALGLGVRSRNENLIFGTMELKGTYFPRTTFFTNKWNITFNTELSFKYNSQFIKKPDFINVN